MNRDEKNKELLQILENLSENEASLSNETSRDKYLSEFRKIYSCGYRHMYSEIEKKIIEINTESSTGEEDINILSQNMEWIYSLVKELINEEADELDFLNQVRKLYDHINLTVIRINQNKIYTIEFENVKNEIDRTSKEVEIKLQKTKQLDEKVKKLIVEAQEEIKESKKQYVSILGIFASIVLGFTTLVSFGSSSLEHAYNGNLIQNLLIISVIGMVIINVLYMLLQFVYYAIYMTRKCSKEDKYLINIKKINTYILIVIFSLIIIYNIKYGDFLN